MVWMTLLACGSIAVLPTDSDTPPPTIPPAPTVPPTTPQTTPTSTGDLALIDDLLAGARTAQDVVTTIAWQGGWPVLDGDEAWFVSLDPGPVSLAGDFNDWVPEAMTSTGGFSYVAVPVGPDPAGLGYKFVHGGIYSADPNARSYIYDENGEISFVAAPDDAPRLDRWPAVSGQGLAARDLRVYVPPGDGPWPVLYAADGQNLFDPGAIWGGWRLLDTLPTLDPLLVVGIDNTFDRLDEYTHVPDDVGLGSVVGGAGDAYADLLHDTIRPHIEDQYGSTGRDGLLGSSLGGLISLHVAWRHPGAYDFVASLSGTLGWGRFALSEETMEQRWLAAAPVGTAVYVDSGGGAGIDGVCRDPDGDGFPEDDPDSDDNYCENRQFADALAANGFVWEQDLWHWHEAGADHSELAWAARVDRPLDLFLGLP